MCYQCNIIEVIFCAHYQVEQLNEQIDLMRMRDNVSQPPEAATPKGKIQVCLCVAEQCLWDKVVPQM